MTELCRSCSGWNDWKGRCEAPFWCPDKHKVNVNMTEDDEMGENNESQKKNMHI